MTSTGSAQRISTGSIQRIRRIDLRGVRAASGAPLDYRAVVPRAEFDIEAATHAVQPILDAVKTRGVEAIREYGERFDGVRVDDIRVPREALTRALAELDPVIRAGLEESIARLRATCANELETDAVTELGPGARVTHRKVPVGRVGLYVPGGLAPLVSSVLMNTVPAQVAGVRSIALASPPQRTQSDSWASGLPHPSILAACELLGVSEVYAVGGAQAIAMFAYGVSTGSTAGATGSTAEGCEKVDLVTGPGNIYVVTAKRLLKGEVGIDSEAGPTEIAILADDSAHPAYVAADLISQAEHDPLAAAVLVTDSEALVAEVEAELDKQVSVTKHVERIRTSLAGSQSGIVLVDDIEQGIEVVNAYAAEHLEIHTRNATVDAGRIRNAGAIFIGPFAPVSLGDYCAGSNHVLPTGGCACHSSGLSVRAFTKSVHVIDYSREGLAAVKDHVVTLAHAEDLPGHGAAVSARFADASTSSANAGAEA
ncbi:histidinol dehydrogenase [Nocardioides sp. Iso805N]|uniref:histidinol dehydrogenase n=1 Tax=Nocardioides sp. Iso805N TaxID=1283287 RepID=UPI0003745794|nr:histidinol dehydrogenase [Nocardioides sp. Iso805N]